MRKRRPSATGSMHSVVLALICISGGLGVEATAQEPLQPGSRVRVTAIRCGLRGQTTTYRALRAGTLVLDATECPLASVTRLYLHRGPKRQAGKGALVGSIVAEGFLLFGMAAACAESLCAETKNAVTVLLVGGASGALIGAGVGALIKSDRWEAVPLDRLGMEITPGPDGRLALGVRVRF